MTRNYKTNWQGKRTSTRFPVTFDATKIASEVKESCTICGGKIEECPMMRGVCYSCYQNITKSPEALTAYRNHAACLLAETMRDCGNCKFQPDESGLPFLALSDAVAIAVTPHIPDCPLCGDTGRGAPTLQEPDGAENGCICMRDDWQIEAEAQAADYADLKATEDNARF